MQRIVSPWIWAILNLPFGATSGFVAVMLAFILKEQGMDDGVIAAIVALNLLPHTFKVLWAPIADSTLTRKRWYVLANLVSCGTILGLALDSFDIASLFNPNTVVASTAGYDVYLEALAIGGTEVTLTSIDDGLHVEASLTDIVGDLYFDCTEFTCELAGGSGTGGLSVGVVTPLTLNRAERARHSSPASQCSPPK